MGTGPINWLSQLREEPNDHSINDMNVGGHDFTVFEIPTEFRQTTPACFELFGLQLGLQHRSLQKSGVQRLKLQLARILDVKLKDNHNSSWDAWVKLIVPNPEHAQKLYENPSGCTDPAVVQYQLALDSLFVVAFFQHQAVHDALDEFRELFNTNRFQFAKLESDFLQVENQVPMEILKAMTMQLCDIHKMMPKIWESDPQITHQEVARKMLDVVLKKAVIYLHPFALPDKAGGCVRWCFGRVENDVHDRWLSYLDKNYPGERADPADPDRSLNSCEHILDCVYRVVCGHLLPAKADPADPDRSLSSWEHILDCVYRVVCGRPLPPTVNDYSHTELRPMPSAMDLKSMGIVVASAALSLRDVKLSGKGYFRDARFHLPKLSVHDTTALQIQNLGIYEQLANANCFDFRCYLWCMNYLIANTADVDLLRKHGVVYSFGSNEDVLQTWDKTSKGLFIVLPSKAWTRCLEGIHRHKKSLWKQWRAEGFVQVLSRFCSKPWLFISLVGALVLLLLTLVQTWLSVVNAPHLKWHFNWS
jgi:hypothetical protein